MRNRNTIEFLGVWEELHNPNFNRVQFEAVKNEAGLNRFVMTPTKWITQMNAIGIVSKAGRYGGTYAHSDIAMSFATWISPEFQLYIMKEYNNLNKAHIKYLENHLYILAKESKRYELVNSNIPAESIHFRDGSC